MDYDVVVVGAGPAGSTAAKNLAEHGVQVLLVDKEKFPRDKPCGGGLPTRVIKQFPYLEHVVNSVSYGSVTHSSSQKYEVKVLRDTPLLAMVLRKKFDYDLVKIAEKKGAKFKDNATVVDCTVSDDKVTITFADESSIDAQMVLGCDGVRSLIAQKLQLAHENSKKCICLMHEQSMKDSDLTKYFTDKRLVHLFIKAQGIAGYGWIFPKKNHINIGMGEFESAVDTSKSRPSLKDTYEDYISFLKEKKMLPPTYTVGDIKGGTLPIYPLQKTFSSRALLCGDAAGFINPITGEGIYYAMCSGEIAASTVLEALQKNDLTETMLAQYQKRWMKAFGKDLRLLGRFNKWWGRDSEKIVRLLSYDRKLARLIIGVTGGQISFTRYKFVLFFRYLFACLKDLFRKK